MSNVRVAVLEGCPIVREGLRLLLIASGFEIAAASGSHPDLVRLCRARPPAVLLLGPSIAVPDLLTSLHAVRRDLPDSRAIVFRLSSGMADLVLAAVEAGAKGFLTRESTSEELAIAVRAVATDARFLSRAAAEQVSYHTLQDQPPSLHSKLSPREYEVFLLLAAGHTLGEIAAILDLSPKTVSTHRARIRAKTGLSSNSEIARYAAEWSLL